MASRTIIYLVDDDPAVRDSLTLSLSQSGYQVTSFPSARAFLEAYEPRAPGCLILDVRMPQMSGLELQQSLADLGGYLPIIFISGHGSVAISVQAIKKGAFDFLEKPFRREALIERIESALTQAGQHQQRFREQSELTARLSSLTERECQVLRLIISGHTNKSAAQVLSLSPRTVESHRARIMRKTQTRSVAALTRLVSAYDGLDEAHQNRGQTTENPSPIVARGRGRRT